MQRFEPHGHDHSGYWGEPDSSIDWCERNYVVTPYIAEFYNTLSNIVLLVVGLFGLWRCFVMDLELRFYAMSFCTIVVGFGSAAFHGTLHYHWQLMDELPMLASMLVWWYSFHMLEKTSRNTLLVAMLILYAAVWCIIHSIFAFTTAFQIHFGVLVIVGIVRLNSACVQTTGRGFLPFVFSGHKTRSLESGKAYPRRPELHPICVGYMIYLLLAFAGWIIDQKACSLLHNLPFGLPNPQLHAVWHVLVGINAQFGMTFVVSLRQSIVADPRATKAAWIRWTCGFWPYACLIRKTDRPFKQPGGGVSAPFVSRGPHERRSQVGGAPPN